MEQAFVLDKISKSMTKLELWNDGTTVKQVFFST